VTKRTTYKMSDSTETDFASKCILLVCDHKAIRCPPLLHFIVCKLACVMMKSPYNKLNGIATTNQLIQDFIVLYHR